jgi:hypothetical protein
VIAIEAETNNDKHEEAHHAPVKTLGQKESPALANDRDLAKVVADVRRREQIHGHFSDGFLLEEAHGRTMFNGETRDRRLKVLLVSLTRLHKAILETDDPPCRLTDIRSAGTERALRTYKLTLLGRKVYTCCKLFLTTGDESVDWLQAYDDHLFNPSMTVMLRAMRRWSGEVGCWPEADEPVLRDAPDAVAAVAVNRLVKFVRRACGTWAFKNEWAKYERQAKANFKSACEFVIDLFARCSRLLVLRVDLYLRPEARSWGYGPGAEKAAQCFLRWLRDRRILRGYLGAIVKRENGIDRGMHWHWMVFFDGHQHRDACGLTRLLGETWGKIVDQGRGSYFNCYARKDEYRFNGLGLVHSSNEEKLLGIRAALCYMTKRDCILRTDNGKQQDFRRSKPRDKREVRRGAPRKNDDNLAVVKRLLGGARSEYPPGFER